ncbi:hypothetical protein ONZ45_g7356 [Pleurotus djamor]|nr:hypothetical protein ONZ45_g7356 [Pleurotus djamor]
MSTTGTTQTTRQALIAERDALKPKSRGGRKPRAATSNSDKENTSAGGSDSIHWKDKALFPKTDELLSIIEESDRYRQIFGFAVDRPVNSGGLTIIGASRAIAPKLFPERDVEKTAASIKNRIHNLKTEYATWKTRLGQTGQGLVESGRQAEIIPDTPIANVWQLMQESYPWYQRFHRLLSVSPIYDQSALANSTTTVDLAVLAPQVPSTRDADIDGVPEVENRSGVLADISLSSGLGFDDDVDSVGPSSPVTPDTPHPLPAGIDITRAPITPAAVTTTTTTTRASTPTPSSAPTPKSVPQKRKQAAAFDTLREVTDGSNQARIKVAEIQAEKKRQRRVEKAKLSLEEEELKLRYQLDRQKDAHQHEERILQLQIQLELVKQGRSQNDAPPDPSV